MKTTPEYEQASALIGVLAWKTKTGTARILSTKNSKQDAVDKLTNVFNPLNTKHNEMLFWTEQMSYFSAFSETTLIKN